MLHTPLCTTLGIEHPILLGGMGSVFAPDLVSAVSNAGGLGTLGCHQLNPEQIQQTVVQIRQKTGKPFGLNFLLFGIREESFVAALAARPAVVAFAWPRQEQDLKPFIKRAHDAGSNVTFMVGGVPEARRAAEAGADVIVAQGTEGGGHVGLQASLPLVPMVVDAVAPIPVVAAGGYADGRGLAAALALGAQGILMGTRFLATVESPLHENFKRAIVESDGHDTVLTEVPDIASGVVWPGAMGRVRRNRFVDRWSGREWALRRDQAEALTGIKDARGRGDAEEAPLWMGQDAGLVGDIAPAGDIVKRVALEAEQILSTKLRAYLR